MSARILLLDIETAPLRGYFWGLWKQNIGTNMLEADWRMLTWAAKWLDEDDIMYDSCHYHKDFEDDREISVSLHALLDEADVVIAHNGHRFDVPKMNTRFLQHGLMPPSPYRQIDTLITAKRMFKITSNRLDFIAKFLGVEGKDSSSGWHLWEGCLNGDDQSFEKMVEYNVQDIRVLEDVYLALRPWMPNHPNVANYTDNAEHECPKCGSSDVQRRGYARTQVGKYRRYQCNDCGGWSRSRHTEQDKEKGKALLTNA